MLRVTVKNYQDAESCPFRDVLDRIGDKWSFLVLAVLEDEAKRFNEIKRLIGDISQRVLTKTLRELERDGYVSRTVYPESPPKVVYELTELGESMLNPLKIFVAWAVDSHQQVKKARQQYDNRKDQN